MLIEEKKKLANKVKLAYEAAGDGNLRKWVGKTAIRDRIAFPIWSTDYIDAVHSTMLAAICSMIEHELISLKEKEDE